MTFGGGRRSSAILGAAVFGVLSACQAPTEGERPEHDVLIIGRAERGATVEVALTTDGTDTIPVLQAQVTFLPATAAEASLSGNGFVLKEAGQVTVRVSHATGVVDSDAIQVVRPPSIVFDMTVAGNRDVYRVDLDGLSQERLTTDPGADMTPTSAKGTLVFTSFRAGNGELYSKPIAAAGGADVRVTTTAANESHARLSPDGQRMIYLRDDGSNVRVWLGRADGTQGAALTSSGFGFGGSTEGSASWRSTSDSIVFMATASGTARVYVVGAAAGATPVEAAAPAGGDSVFVEPAWSADASLLAFTVAGPGGSSRIAVRRRLDGAMTLVTPANISCGQPVFLADGRLVFTVFDSVNATHMAWIDTADPDAMHPIMVAGTTPQNPAVIWP